MRHVRRLGDAPESLDRDALGRCLAEFPVSLAVLFGSWSRDRAGPLSDLDVAVAFETDVADDRKPRLLDELTAAVARATGFEAVDVVDLEAAPPAFGYEILSRGEVLFDEDDRATDMEARLLVRKLDFQHVRADWQSALSERIAGGEYGRPR